jgi:hypothetical protein
MLPPMSAVIQNEADQLTSYIVSFKRQHEGSYSLYDDAYPDALIIELLPS